MCLFFTSRVEVTLEVKNRHKGLRQTHLGDSGGLGDEAHSPLPLSFF